VLQPKKLKLQDKTEVLVMHPHANLSALKVRWSEDCLLADRGNVKCGNHKTPCLVVHFDIHFRNSKQSFRNVSSHAPHRHLKTKFRKA